eukprot:14191213-Alexandrium_andersonii.AAC.1
MAERSGQHNNCCSKCLKELPRFAMLPNTINGKEPFADASSGTASTTCDGLEGSASLSLEACGQI